MLATVLAGGLHARGAALGDPRSQGAALVAFHSAFLAAAFLALLAAVLALFVDDRLAAGTMRRARETTPAYAAGAR